MPVFVGIDGGGTRTRCAVSLDGVVVGRGISAGCNIVRLGESVARASIHSCILQAFQAAGLDRKSAQVACIGAAGSGVPHVREAILRIVGELLPRQVIAVGDEEIAYEAAFGDSPGILVIAGTGSIAFGRNRNGKTAHAGGHGFIISDEGSGQWIGRTAISQCLRSTDAAGTTCTLLELLLAEFRVSTPGELIQAANAVPLPDFSRLLPIILKAALDDDPIACEVLRRAGQELASLAALVASNLGQSQGFRVAMAGGVFDHCKLVREEFERSIRAFTPGATSVGVVTEPLQGALSIAQKAKQPQFQHI